MKKKYLFGGIIVIFVLLFVFTFVIKPKQDNDKTIRLASSPGPYSELFLKGVKPILEKEGYKVKNQSFSDLSLADVAINNGEADLNVDQHTAYMNNFNNEKHAHLAALTKIPTVPTGIYPARKHSLKEVADGDKVAIPNDPSNMARAYNVLVKAGWITLKPGVDPIKATSKDIATNKDNLKITEMQDVQIPRSRSDFDYVILPGSTAYPAKISTKTMLLPEDIKPDYYLVAAVDKKSENKKWAKAVKKAYHSKEFKQYLKDHNKQSFWKTPKGY
ncbi:MetQ/NlpA family ABC transporter substrate-binding protein [Fructilactobacillus hinvesii]|uniref:MetQ/NlpA family ABC transporter substrate-binding protein n=1 Tax=Fructilactobacillus hinvesii TaxID=2940300 RepID=A0ABY5BTT2_9LACO|nr:MetQ/NlpA family ABC transporter substrate-binding protein [Fructilactobacillus hinvesii]USS88540.1 MetQ/NlpA family ABC transporter substrate-binding protein [Fructilactobacillus hinvesii]